MKKRILIVANPEEIHVGAHFRSSAEALGLEVKFCDTREAFYGSVIARKINWWIKDRRPSSLLRFSKRMVEASHDFASDYMLTTGISPIEENSLIEIKKSGVKTINYLTDNPWNSAHKANWFLKTLPVYDYIFSTRQSSIENLRKLGCKNISYLPFAYEPRLHFTEPPSTSEEKIKLSCDVVFIGGADKDRLSYAYSLIESGLNVALYGGYWDRYPKTKKYALGHANPETMRKAIKGAKIALCLVRRANCDDNSMRTFEIPAIGGCMLTEDTDEHRKIFGNDGEAVLYFKDEKEMLKKTRFLLSNSEKRKEMADKAKNIITKGANTYKDRLDVMIRKASEL